MSLPKERRVGLAIAASLAVVGAFAVPAVHLIHRSDGPAATPRLGSAISPGQVSPPVGALGESTLTEGERGSLDGAIARLRTMPVVSAVTSVDHPAVTGPARRQPDLYAAAFTRQLLTQDYRTSRQALLQWVQSESAGSTEPTVVGLTPVALRPRMAVASVQDRTVGSPAPVPSPTVWAARGDLDGHTTVAIQRITTPIGWADAVAAGRITDPGVTAREVDATVTLHTFRNGHPKTTAASVALTINLEGPPTHAGYGFVTAVTYTVVGVR